MTAKKENQQKWILIALLIGLFEIMFINAMSSIVGPNIVADLGNSELYAAMFTVTFLCSSLALPVSTSIGVKTGRKQMIALGAILFGVGSCLCGASTSMPFHVFARGVQGIGNGTLLGNVLAYFGESFDEQGRAKAMGLYGSLTGVVYLVAPLIGGVIGDLLGWRLTYYLAIPLTVIVVVMVLAKMPEEKLNSEASFDTVGTVLLSIATISLVCIFSFGGQKFAWNSPAIILMAVACALCLYFFVRHIKNCENPIISPKLFKNREFRLVVYGVVLIGPTLYAIGSYISLISQAICGTNATQAGLVTAAKSLVQLLLGYAFGAYIGKTGKVKNIMILTSVVYAVSNAMLGLVKGPGYMVMFIIGILLSGLGTTTYSMVYTLHAQNELPKELVGEGTSAIQFLQSLSGTIGLSIVGMVLNTSFARNLANVVPVGLESMIPAEQLQSYMGTALLTNKTAAEAAMSSLTPEGQALFETFLGNLRNAFAGAMGNAMFVLAAFAAVSLIFSLMVQDSKK